MRKKVSIIGAGNVGATLAQLVVKDGLWDVVLYDIAEGMPQGKALDLAEACPLWGASSSIIGTNQLSDTAHSGLVVITAGFPRKPGMSRDDLLKANAEVVGTVAEAVAAHSPEAVIIVVTNPMDAMAQLAWKRSGLPAARVAGMGGLLDSARLRAFIGWELGVAPSDVEALVIGGHGDQMVAVEALMSVKGVPLENLLSREKIGKLVERTRHGGAEVVSLLKTGSAYYAPAASAYEMVKAVMLDEKRLMACSAYLSGQYGALGVYAGVPVVLGAEGVEKILEVPLAPEQREAFFRSVDSVKSLIDRLDL
jgi:malate dehydrogenase